jgi:hypothetical protein
VQGITVYLSDGDIDKTIEPLGRHKINGRESSHKKYREGAY